MEHLVCLNTNSFPARSSEDGCKLFEDTLQGLLRLNTGGDRFTLFIDSVYPSLLDFPISENFTYSDFLTKLSNDHEHDLLFFLTELEDKSPALDYVDDDIFEQMAEYNFYIPDCAVLKYPDILSLSFFLDAVLLSIDTGSPWDASKISIARTVDGEYINEILSINHISRAGHGEEIFDSYTKIDIRAICEPHHITPDFSAWFDQLGDENRQRVAEKLRLACERGFSGGKPLFDTLVDADGIREVRLSAYPGGAVRILFKAIQNARQAILLGFIKKSDNEGYKNNIEKAKGLLKGI